MDLQRDCETLKESKKFEKMLEDHKILLYPDCKQALKKLGNTLEILQWKTANGVTDKGFEELLGIIKNMLPEGNELPSTTYEAKKVVCPLVFSIEVNNMRNWMLVLSVMQNDTRSGKMILVRSTGSPSRKKFPLR